MQFGITLSASRWGGPHLTPVGFPHLSEAPYNNNKKWWYYWFECIYHMCHNFHKTLKYWYMWLYNIDNNESYNITYLFFIVQKQHKTHTVNSWVHWQTWKRHWGILAVQKHNVTEQTNKTFNNSNETNLISDDFSLEPAYVMTITLQYSTNECLKKGVSPQFYCCTDAFSTFDLDVRG